MAKKGRVSRKRRQKATVTARAVKAQVVGPHPLLSKGTATVEVEVAPTGARFSLRIDGAPVMLVGGKGKRAVAGAREHVFQYYVLAQPGTKYTVAITDPIEARGKWTATIDKGGHDANQVWFWTD